jgi:PAS domain S-box-containing protein
MNDEMNDSKEILTNLKNQEFLVNISNYLNSSLGNFENRIRNILNILGRYIGVSRAYIFEDYGNGRLTRNTFEWCTKGVSSEIDKNQRIAYKIQIPGWQNRLLKDGIIAGETDSFPDEIKRILEMRSVKALIVLPLFIRSDYAGFIGFDYCDKLPAWDRIDINFLKTVANSLSSSFERRLVNQEIKASEAKFRDLFDNSSDSIIIYDTYGNILEVNQQACNTLGYTKEELTGEELSKICTHFNVLKEIAKSEKESDTQNSEIEFTTGDNRKFPVEIKTKAINFNNRRAVMCVARDISERKQLEREVLAAIIQTEEKERGRIARDIHDGLGPLLSSLKLYVKVMHTSTDSARKEQVYKTANDIIDDAIMQIKEITNNLSPHVLIDFGLASAIQAFCKKITLAKTIDIKFESNVFEQRLNPNVEVVIFRVVKELVNNTIKHALASMIEIFLLRTEKTLSLIYSDNGVGFEINKILDDKTSGMGLSNIINRIHSVNGKLKIESQPRKGIQVKIEVDLNE